MTDLPEDVKQRVRDFNANICEQKNDSHLAQGYRSGDLDDLLGYEFRLAAALSPAPAEVVTGEECGLTALRVANVQRDAEWCPDEKPDLSFRGNELAGEAGEANNIIKKLVREQKGWRGSRASLNDLAEELADVVISTDLTAMTAGIDLATAVASKFNATSEKYNLATRLSRMESGKGWRTEVIDNETAQTILNLINPCMGRGQ